VTRRRGTALAVLALGTALAAAPAPSPAGAPLRIEAVEVTGATRTTRATVLAIARVHEGDPWHEGMAGEVRRRLLNERIFYDVTVEARPAGAGVALRIALRDKWSLVPIPLVVVRDGKTTYGLTLLESNLFGRAKRLFAFGAVEDGTAGGTLLYIDPRLGDGDWELFTLASRTDRDEEVWDAGDEVGSFRRRSAGGVLALGRRIRERLRVSAGLRGFDHSQRDAAGEAALPPDARERAVSLRLEWDGLDREEEAQRGTRLRVELGRGVGALGDDLGRTTFEAELRHAVNPMARHTLTLEGRAYRNGDPDYPAGRPTEFLRGYERWRFRPELLLGASAEYRVPVARRREATLAVDVFADGAVLRDGYRRMSLEELQADAGLALAVYLRRVAVPVLQIYAAYGFASGRVLPGFSLGFGF